MKNEEASAGQSTAEIKKSPSQNRSYQKKARAEAEKATGEAILNAAYEAFAYKTFDRVTLQDIADESRVSVQTVIRRYGSKEELFQTLAERETPRILASRESPRQAGLEASLEALLNHYEKDGDVVLNFIAQEHLFGPVREIVEKGRKTHREWVTRHCSDIISGTEGEERERLIHAAIAATDLSTWKLLRRDLGLSLPEVRAVMIKLLNGLNKE